MTQALPATLPGVYPGPGRAPLLRVNEQQWLFRQQLIAAGQASIAVQLERNKKSGPYGASVQIWFTDVNGVAANPGTFEVDVQASDLDQPGLYGLEYGLTAVSATFSGRIELQTNWMLYLRVYVATLTNAVYTNALVSR